MVCLSSPPPPPTSPAPQLLPVEERCRMGAPDKQTPNALGMGAQSIFDVSFSLGKDKPVANEKAGPLEGFRQGSLTGLSHLMGEWWASRSPMEQDLQSCSPFGLGKQLPSLFSTRTALSRLRKHTVLPNKGTRYLWRSWLKHHRNVLLK